MSSKLESQIINIENLHRTERLAMIQMEVAAAQKSKFQFSDENAKNIVENSMAEDKKLLNDAQEEIERRKKECLNIIDYEDVSAKIWFGKSYHIQFQFSNSTLYKLAQSFIYLPSPASFINDITKNHNNNGKSGKRSSKSGSSSSSAGSSNSGDSSYSSRIGRYSKLLAIMEQEQRLNNAMLVPLIKADSLSDYSLHLRFGKSVVRNVDLFAMHDVFRYGYKKVMINTLSNQT